MLDTPHIATTAACQTAVIHLTIPRSEIRHVMGPGIAELMATVAAQGVTPTGPWFSHHLAMHLWEVYVTGPESDPDPANWRTELNQPLA